MRSMLLIHTDESTDRAPGAPGADQMSEAYAAVVQEMAAAGALVAGERLQPTSTATSIRCRDGRLQLVDGPYAETREQLGGFFVLETPSIEEAKAFAARVPAVERGAVEVAAMAGFGGDAVPAEGAGYILLIYGAPDDMLHVGSPEHEAMMAGHQALTERLTRDKAYVTGDALVPPVLTARAPQGKVLFSDGPFPETKEQLGGFYLIRARDLDHALGYGKALAEFSPGCVEVRPIWEMA